MFYNSLTPKRNFLQSWPWLSYSVPQDQTGQYSGEAMPVSEPIKLGAPGFGGYGEPYKAPNTLNSPLPMPFEGGWTPQNWGSKGQNPFAVQQNTGLSSESSGRRLIAPQNGSYRRPGIMGVRQKY